MAKKKPKPYIHNPINVVHGPPFQCECGANICPKCLSTVLAAERIYGPTLDAVMACMEFEEKRDKAWALINLVRLLRGGK